MADYGLTENGFNRMRLPEIRAAILEALQANLKQRSLDYDVAYRPDTVLGVLIDTFAEREAEMWETAELVYNAMYPSTAIGTQLDNAGSFTGAMRGKKSKSQAKVVLYGQNGTEVAEATQIRNSATQALWQTSISATISANNAAACTITPKPVSSFAYVITVGAMPLTYTSGPSSDLGSILTGLVAVLSAAGLDISSNGASIVMNLLDNPSSVMLGANLTFAEVGSLVAVEPIEIVDDEAAIGDLNTIVTLTTGWSRVYNHAAAIVGSGIETDEQFRVSYEAGIYRQGSGTQNSIAANLSESIEGVTYVRVLQNDTDSVKDGMTPHSIWVVIEGGNEDAIASALHHYKGAGIDTNGSTEKLVKTGYGDQLIKFSRPKSTYVWVRVDYTQQDASEGQFPIYGEVEIAEAINTQLAKLNSGEDVLFQSLYKAIYSVSGVASAEVKLFHSTNPLAMPAPEQFTAANIPIAMDERAVADLTRITVIQNG